jgi:hypothetical protein
MDRCRPQLPTDHAFLVQFRTQSPGLPVAWEGRVEHVDLGQVTPFLALEERLAFVRHVLAGVRRPSGSPETRLTTCFESARGAVATTEL